MIYIALFVEQMRAKEHKPRINKKLRACKTTMGRQAVQLLPRKTL